MGSVSDFDLLAASLRADAVDLHAFLGALAVKLEATFPGSARVERAGLFGNKRVRKIAVELGESRYEIGEDSGRISTRRCTVVRGITLKNDHLDLDEWIESLSRELVAEAERSGRGRAALERLLR